MDSISASGDVDEQWRAFIAAQREAGLERIIAEEGLKPAETRAFLETAFREGSVRGTGTAITRILPPLSRFSPDGAHAEQKGRVLARLGAYFERFFGLGAGEA